MSAVASNGKSIFSDIEWAEITEELSLSLREGQIIKCLFADKPDKKIAIDLKISIPTVRTHMARLFKKLGANDREDLLLHVFGRFRQNCRKLDCPRFR
jgi:DNA-binding CsgD family transcriptional regulator